MYKYKIDVIQALNDKGYTSYRFKKDSNLNISQGTLQKLKNGENVTLETLNIICVILRCQLSDVIEIEPTNEEKVRYF